MDLHSITCDALPALPLKDRMPVQGRQHVWHWHLDPEGDDFPCSGRLTAVIGGVVA